MNVSELIIKLNDYNPNAVVLTKSYVHGGFVGIETAIEYVSIDEKKETANAIYMSFNTLDE